ncbi:hypothetical protein VM98_35615, partial [Streptomyces rubellomurinus subsp. indigoferus]
RGELVVNTRAENLFPALVIFLIALLVGLGVSGLKGFLTAEVVLKAFLNGRAEAGLEVGVQTGEVGALVEECVGGVMEVSDDVIVDVGGVVEVDVAGEEDVVGEVENERKDGVDILR